MSRLLPRLLAVTVRTPKYQALSLQAVKRVELHLGLPVQVIECDDAKAFAMKLRLDRLCPATRILFFDADWWPLRNLDFSGYSGGSWLAVHDAGVFHPAAFCMPDSATMGIPREWYFNSGFFVFDNTDSRHRRAFQAARDIEHSIFTGERARLHDFGEQSLLNAGVQQAGVPVQLLPFSMNTMLHFVRGGVFPYIPRVVHAVHAAGVPLKQKMRHLRAAAELLSFEPEPMQPEALAFHHALSFETR